MTSKARWLGLGLGILLIAGAFGLVFLQEQGLKDSGVALAQGAPTATPVAPGARTTPSTQTPAQKPDLSTYVDAFWNALAKQLGLTVDQTKGKVTAAEKDVIEQMVTDGKITRSQADKLEQNLNNNQPFMHGGFFFKGRGPRGNFGQPPGIAKGIGRGFAFGLDKLAVLEAVAKSLNLTPDALTTQLKSGKTLADIATAQKVDQTVVKQAIIDATKAELTREVTDGLITQDQANTIQSNLTLDKIDLTRYGLKGWGRH
ncbi:MAG: hypothetical protein ACM3JD_09545 [Rudaea sp.]